jgi:hypothetical protein
MLHRRDKKRIPVSYLIPDTPMVGTRFFPGPQGTGADVVIPMTDYSLPEVDEERLTKSALDEIIQRTGKTRQRLRDHGFAQGNKIASELRIKKDDVTREHIPIELHGGPTLREDFSFMHKLPQTPATLKNVPQTFAQLADIYADKMMGGNTSNVLRNLVQLSKAQLGPSAYHMFSPPDNHLDTWLQQNLRNGAENRFTRHELQGINSRVGLALPYDDGTGRIQQFSFNTPQGYTMVPMEPHLQHLEGLDHVVVSEGIGVILAQYKISIQQIFNPTSALHTESALEMHRRKSESGIWRDIAIVNDDEMEEWIRTMENKQYDISKKDVPDAKFPMPCLKSDPLKIDDNAVEILRTNHQRLIILGTPEETQHTTVVMGIGCGPKGGQNQFQSKGRYYVSAASTPSEEGAGRLVELCNSLGGQGVKADIRDVVGAGDAAFTATLMHRLYSPLEDIIEAREPKLSDERKRIASMAFTTILQRVFGELVYHSKVRDLSEVPPEAFPIIFDKVLDKAIACAHKLTTIDKVPTNVYFDEEWGISFMTMEVERAAGSN